MCSSPAATYSRSSRRSSSNCALQSRLRLPRAIVNFPVSHGRYYSRIFPAELMCRWLGYGTEKEKSAADNLLCRREFSFTTGDDVYIRYLSYESADAFRMVRPTPTLIRRRCLLSCHASSTAWFCAQDLCKKLPYKIDIGAVFTADPRDHKKFKLFEPMQREFLIDIDLTDYEFLDCDVKKIETCDRCWPIMALAARVLNQILVHDFGFEHLLFVYSGRRGIHCWGCDSRARVMSNDVRSAVADYLTPKLNAATGRLAIAQPMHPSLRRAYDEHLEPFFKTSILGSEQDGGFGELDKEAGQERLLTMLGDEEVKVRFLESWSRGAGAEQVAQPAPAPPAPHSPRRRSPRRRSPRRRSPRRRSLQPHNPSPCSCSPCSRAALLLLRRSATPASPRLCAERAGEVEQLGQARAQQEEPRALDGARRDRLLLHLPAAGRQRQ